MKHLEELKELLLEQVKKITKKGDISVSELDSVYKVVDIIKDIGTIEAMEGSEGEYSQRGGNRMYSYARGRGGSYDGSSYEGNSREGGSYGRGGNSYRGGSYDGGSYEGNSNEYSEESSYRRGRDSRGRFTSRAGSSYGNSRDGSREEMVSTLEQMMEQAPGEKERQAIMQCIEKLEG